MSSLQIVMRFASAVRRKRQRSTRLRPIFPGRVGVSIGRDAEPSDQSRHLSVVKGFGLRKSREHKRITVEKLEA
jgi:hypothetical protein